MAQKTPGVYIEEISLFPPSVAEVETAIPAFIGYTEKAVDRGEDLTNKPTRISSLLEFRDLFGGAHEITSLGVAVDTDNNYAVKSLTLSPRFYLYDSLRQFFDNGGGDCYIVSVGSYGDTIQNDDPSAPGTKGLRVGLSALEKYDEPTMILFPDATLLATEDHFYTLQQQAVAQCAKLQDRVCVFDLYERSVDWKDSVSNFRDKIGINNLKYGAAYTPWLYTTYAKQVDFGLLIKDEDTVKDTADPPVKVVLSTITSDDTLNELVTTAERAVSDRDSVIDGPLESARGNSPTLKDEYRRLRGEINASNSPADNNKALQDLMDFIRTLIVGDAPVDGLTSWATALTTGSNLKNDLDAYAASTLKGALEGLIALEKNLAPLTSLSDPSDAPLDSGLADEAAVDAAYGSLDATGWLGPLVADTVANTNAGTEDYASGGTLNLADTLQAVLADLDAVFYKNAEESILAFTTTMQEAAKTHARLTQGTLYQEHTIIGNIVEHIKREMNKVPPGGAVAGLYAFVDRTRGVWKAPANVSVSSVSGPVEQIDHAEQESLNVDVNSGKSINAIRSFTGRGTIVWGARTLAGNDNEWRYVPVRRFFNMVEESAKKSTSWAVFEPNDAGLWNRVKSMISNYLIQKWRDGALAGAVPDDAFFVKIGLGQTMTAQDILEGRLIVEIGMAAVRPAEFIVLRFSHKMQQS